MFLRKWLNLASGIAIFGWFALSFLTVSRHKMLLITLVRKHLSKVDWMVTTTERRMRESLESIQRERETEKGKCVCVW